MVYDDFVVQILPGPGDGFQVRAASGGAEVDGTLVVPAELATSPWAPRVLSGRDIRPVSSEAASPALGVREVGERLFQALFTAKILGLFDRSLPDPQREPGRGLRIRLKIDRRLGMVLGLPWELLHVPNSRDFLGLGRRTPIIRSLDVPHFVEPVLPAVRLRILVIASNPTGYPALDLATERRHLEAVAGWRRNLDIVFLPTAGREELREALLEARDQKDPFHVLHFMGHGSFLAEGGEGVLLFEKDDHFPEEITGESLAEEIKDFPSLRLVVLNACQTGQMTDRSGLDPFAGVASALVLEGVPAVIAMRSRISDEAAITFSKTFYRRLVKGDPVDVAIAECRLAIRRKEEAEGEWGLLLAFLRGPVQPLFQVQPDPRLRGLTSGTVGAALFALFVAVLPFGLRSQPLVNQVPPAAMDEALKLNNEGVALLDQRKSSEARDTFIKALQKNPGFAPAHVNLADLDASQGRYADALDHARAALRAAPKTALYEYNLGIILSHMGRKDEALEHLDRATKLDPCPAKAFNERGNVFLDLALPADARQEIEQGLRCDPTFAPLHKNLARVDLAHGRNEDAIRNLEQALPLYDPRDARGSAEALYWLAVANSHAGHRETACETLGQLQAQGSAGVLWAYEAKGLAQQERCDGVFKER